MVSPITLSEPEAVAFSCSTTTTTCVLKIQNILARMHLPRTDHIIVDYYKSKFLIDLNVSLWSQLFTHYCPRTSIHCAIIEFASSPPKQ